jgi:single-strand DNA-binding protein
MNNVQLIGRLGKEPEARTTGGGTSVVNVSLAVSKRIKNGEDQTTWVRLVFWDKLAQVVLQYCRKGSQIAIVGELQARDYLKDGVSRTITEVRVHGLDLLGGKSETRHDSPAREREPGSDDDLDDEIPF